MKNLKRAGLLDGTDPEPFFEEARKAGLEVGSELGLTSIAATTATETPRLAAWLAGRGEALAAALARHGAILFRGFGVDRPEVLEDVASQVVTRVFTENGEHQPVAGSAAVQTPVAFDAHQRLLWHNENTFSRDFPSKILFACAQPAAQGGETPIVDSRAVAARLDSGLRRRLEEVGVMYVRHYSDTPGLGLDWRQAFRVTDRAALEARCRREAIDFEWLADGRLRTRAIRPALGAHPLTGEVSLFAQIQHFHPACLDEETRESFEALFAEEDFPRHCHFGDGRPIADDDVLGLLDLYEELEQAFPWQTGDVMVVDNIAAAHGRNPYQGKRRLLVSMGDLIRYDLKGQGQLVADAA